MTAPREPKLDISRDESALRDALAALDYFDDEATQLETARNVAAIRRRLPDHGARVDAALGRDIHFERGANQADDPPGTVRLRRVVPGGPVEDEPYPRGPRNGVVVAAALAVVALVGL